MAIDEQTDEPVRGVAQPPPRRRGIRETVLAVGVAAVIAGLGGAAIYAATGPHSQQMFGRGLPGGPPPGGFSAQHLAAGPVSLHVEFVVADGGAFSTMLTQTGAVTAISETAITVRSADAFTQTYDLQPAAHTDQRVGVADEVSIQGTRTDGVTTATAVNIQRGPGSPAGPPGPAPHN
jgi:hypothetical protein